VSPSSNVTQTLNGSANAPTIYEHIAERRVKFLLSASVCDK
jgi:hypothetical protein